MTELIRYRSYLKNNFTCVFLCLWCARPKPGLLKFSQTKQKLLLKFHVDLLQYASSKAQLISWLDEVKANGGNSVRQLNKTF